MTAAARSAGAGAARRRADRCSWQTSRGSKPSSRAGMTAPRSSVEAYRRAIDALHGEALRRLIRALQTRSRGARGDESGGRRRCRLCGAAPPCAGQAKPQRARRNGARRACGRCWRRTAAMSNWSTSRRRQSKCASPARCDGCAASALTFHAGVKKAVEEACPEITDVVQVKGAGGARSDRIRFTSPFALDAKGGWLPAGRLADIPENGVRALTLGGENVVLTRRGSAVTCFQDACAHLGLALHRRSRSRTASSPVRITASATTSPAANA